MGLATGMGMINLVAGFGCLNEVSATRFQCAYLSGLEASLSRTALSGFDARLGGLHVDLGSRSHRAYARESDLSGVRSDAHRELTQDLGQWSVRALGATALVDGTLRTEAARQEMRGRQRVELRAPEVNLYGGQVLHLHSQDILNLQGETVGLASTHAGDEDLSVEAAGVLRMSAAQSIALAVPGGTLAESCAQALRHCLGDALTRVDGNLVTAAQGTHLLVARNVSILTQHSLTVL
jgi:hypothetical protein